MDKKKINSMIRRMQKANKSYGVLGSMILTWEIQNLSVADCAALIHKAHQKEIDWKPWQDAVEYAMGASHAKPI